MSNMVYVAKNMEDIAKYFDKCAENEASRRIFRTTKKAVDRALTAQRTFEHCADFIRNVQFAKLEDS